MLSLSGSNEYLHSYDFQSPLSHYPLDCSISESHSSTIGIASRKMFVAVFPINPKFILYCSWSLTSLQQTMEVSSSGGFSRILLSVASTSSLFAGFSMKRYEDVPCMNHVNSLATSSFDVSCCQK